MSMQQAGLAGALCGLLFGCAVCLVQAIPIPDALLRIVVLAVAGSWMGVLLVWLNQLLPSETGERPEQKGGGQ